MVTAIMHTGDAQIYSPGTLMGLSWDSTCQTYRSPPCCKYISVPKGKRVQLILCLGGNIIRQCAVC